MKIYSLSILFYLLLIFNANAELSFLKKTLEKSPGILPFNYIKNTAEKISSLGMKKLLFGFTGLAMVAEAFEDSDQKINSSQNRNIKNLGTDNIRRIFSKGQIYINNIDKQEAKRRALEDALYYASIKGGVKVDGFSSINNDTSLEEHFTVRPESKILDYKLLKSYEENGIYIVEIEAIIGNISNKAKVCRNNKPITLNEFKGSQFTNTNVPAEYARITNNLLNLIGNNLNIRKSIQYFDNKDQYYNFNSSNFDLSFDYKTLVNGSQNVKYGDFIYIPNIKIQKSTIKPLTYLVKNQKTPAVDNPNFFLDTDVLKLNASIDVYNGVSNNLVARINEKYLIPLNLDSNFGYVELFSKNDQEYVYNEIQNIALDLSNIIEKELICLPLTANINFVNNKLIVPLGEQNGIRKNQLAVLENSANDNNNFTILSVSSLTANSATLEPLNSTIKLFELSGKKTRFLE